MAGRCYFVGVDIWIEHPGHRDVGALMRLCVEMFAEDVRPVAHFSIQEIFDHVANLPYIADANWLGNKKEAVTRPARFGELRGLDCKKKAIYVACWARLNGFPFRFIAVDDTGGGISHVFADVYYRGGWVTMDCTLPRLYRPGSKMSGVRFAEVIGG